MAPPIQLTGGTGTPGVRVVRRMREAGRDVRLLGRRGYKPGDGIELVTGDLAAGEEDKSSHLLRAPSRAEHVVYVSVIGVNRVPVVNRVERADFGYFEPKLAPDRDVEQRSREELLAEGVGGPVRQAGDTVGTAVSANVGLSREPQCRDDGSPTGLPTGPIRRSRR